MAERKLPERRKEGERARGVPLWEEREAGTEERQARRGRWRGSEATRQRSSRGDSGVEGGRGGRGEGGWRGEEAREKDIKVRNSQRGERAPPRHRLDRGSLVPLLGCSPPLLLFLDPPTYSPSALYPPVHHPQPILSTERSPRPPNHPPPPTPSNWRAPEYVLYIHTRALMSVPVLPLLLPLPLLLARLLPLLPLPLYATAGKESAAREQRD